jgi:hypothetical protein
MPQIRTEWMEKPVAALVGGDRRARFLGIHFKGGRGSAVLRRERRELVVFGGTKARGSAAQALCKLERKHPANSIYRALGRSGNVHGCAREKILPNPPAPVLN